MATVGVKGLIFDSCACYTAQLNLEFSELLSTCSGQ